MPRPANVIALGDGIEVVREACFWPEGEWSIRKDRGAMCWSTVAGWQRLYESIRADCIFRTAEDALKVWKGLEVCPIWSVSY